MSKTIAVQCGHCFRKRGATGTAGHRGTEQDFVFLLGAKVRERLMQAGHTVVLLKADERVPKCDGFISLHQDGSTNPRARGMSVGYWPGNKTRNVRFVNAYKTLTTFFGWPHESGFRPNNYTSALSGYYAWRRSVSYTFGNVRKANFQVLLETGFATNRDDEDWVWDNVDTVAWNIGNAVQAFYELPALPADVGEPVAAPPPVVKAGPWRVQVPIFRPKLRVGSSHRWHVRAVQELLGVYVDGFFGSETEERVRVFQTFNGLPVDGVVSGDDWAVLDRINDARPRRADV